jgi:hypothetical protein
MLAAEGFPCRKMMQGNLLTEDKKGLNDVAFPFQVCMESSDLWAQANAGGQYNHVILNLLETKRFLNTI